MPPTVPSAAAPPVPTAPQPRLSPAVLALSASTFALGFAEFVAVSLVPSVAADTGLSAAAVGLMIGIYALGVSIGAPLLSVWWAGRARPQVLAGCMGLFALANVWTAATADLTPLLVSRLLAGLMHGVVLALASATAAAAAGPGRAGSAIALVFAGLTAALVVGVPLGTWAAGRLPWQSVFFTIAAIAALGAWALLHHTPGVAATPPHDARVWRATLGDGATRRALLVTALTYTGSFTGFTYISVLLMRQTGLDAAGVAVLFALYGVSAALGNAGGGRWVDRVGSRVAAMSVIGGVALVQLGALLGAASVPAMAAVMALWGWASFAAVPVLQKTVLMAAQRQPRASAELASGLNIAAFNVGIALGASLGAWALQRSVEVSLLVACVPLAFAAALAAGFSPATGDHVFSGD